ncbi:MAG: hypothetical protein H6932_05570 [Burkholderiaceae bacterium]|nr:hypothetical protein [Burkholderiaceae bacterium]
MDELDRLPSVKQGLWFHGGVTTCHVRIVRHHLLYGSHDADDPPELADDRAMDCYYVRYDLPVRRAARRTPPAWQDGGAALSLREAVFLAQRKLGPVISWDD